MLAEPQVGCVVTHFFAPGIYVRTVTVEAGVFAVGHRHRLPHLNIVLAGAVAMRHEHEDESQIRVIRAPHMYNAPPGRKMGLVLERLVWQNVFPTTETDVEKLEEQLFDKSPTYQARAGQVLAQQSLDRAADRADFHAVLDELCISPYDARAISEREDDQIPMPGGWPIVIRKSAIEGRGVFVQLPVEPGEVIGPARVGDHRTPAGRFANHSRTPTARFEEADGCIYLVALSRIDPYCNEQVPGDEVTVDYRQVLKLAGGRLA